MAYTTWFNPKTGKYEVIQLSDNLPKLEVDSEGKVPGTGGGGGFYVGDEPPEDTNLIWIDTSDDTIDEDTITEVTTNKVTSLSNASTDTQYPSAKCVYDELGNKQNTLTAGTGISIVGDTISATGGGTEIQSDNNGYYFEV